MGKTSPNNMMYILIFIYSWAPLDGKPTVEESETKLSYRMTFHPKYFAEPPDSLMTRLQKKSEEVKRLEKEEWNPIHKCGMTLKQIIRKMKLI